ncbi:MAG: serine/threonine-protein kinase [Polyangiales bacterium]
MPDADAVVVGDKYRVLRPIGRGGMGAVFEAEHALTGRRVAVKVLLPQFAENEVLAKRFVNEARAAARIQDPHVVEVVDLGRTPAGELYIVLEYLDGRELKAAIREEAPFPAERACHVAAQVAALMGKAHALGIVHRDLKPANVFLLARDRDADYAKVLDFGIAKLRPAEPQEGEHTQLTRTHDVVGTPLYMAPEQLKGSREVDARADVYSMGVMLFQMLSARLPFTGESMADIFLKVMTESPPPLASLRPDLPADLAAVVARCLDRDPARRFADGAALAEALAPWADAWSPNVPRTAPGYAPGALGPVTGTTPAPAAPAPARIETAPAAPRPAPDVTPPVSVAPVVPAPSGRGRGVALALVGAAAVLALAWVAARPRDGAAPVERPAPMHEPVASPHDAVAMTAPDASPDVAVAPDVAAEPDVAVTLRTPRPTDLPGPHRTPTVAARTRPFRSEGAPTWRSSSSVARSARGRAARGGSALHRVELRRLLVAGRVCGGVVGGAAGRAHPHHAGVGGLLGAGELPRDRGPRRGLRPLQPARRAEEEVDHLEPRLAGRGDGAHALGRRARGRGDGGLARLEHPEPPPGPHELPRLVVERHARPHRHRHQERADVLAGEYALDAVGVAGLGEVAHREHRATVGEERLAHGHDARDVLLAVGEAGEAVEHQLDAAALAVVGPVDLARLLLERVEDAARDLVADGGAVRAEAPVDGVELRDEPGELRGRFERRSVLGGVEEGGGERGHLRGEKVLEGHGRASPLRAAAQGARRGTEE